ncbi:MAG TPA: hypothetical protein PKV86_09255 [Syntrophobacteraceae bacterium]|nr:hypothetical protein [Syntrophobacteraceae bacterium]
MQGLYLCIDDKHLADFFCLLQRGFRVATRVGISVETILTREFGLDKDSLDRIQTVFLDGKAVDDLESSFVKDGSVLALSSAMPGLVGATLRRGGYYAGLRSHITSSEETPECIQAKQGLITLKLFNLLIRALGPVFLKKGILVERNVLWDFLAGQPSSFWMSCREARLDGCKLEIDALLQRQWTDADDLIRLEIESNPPVRNKALSRNPGSMRSGQEW